jgi:chromosome transmission fidelity protein 1
VIIVPYNTLLHKPTRESVGIRLKNAVVIVDEAHNLLDTISHIHSAEVRGDQLLQVNSKCFYVWHCKFLHGVGNAL